MFRKVRSLFSHGADAEYDGDRPRDPYMDVLREIQRPPATPHSNGLRGALARFTSPRARATESLRK
jgi:hypothetical protein